MGFPLSKAYVEVVVRDYLKNINRSSSFGPGGIPGQSWWEGFLRRWPTLVKRKSQHLSRQRAQCSMHEVVDAFFDQVRNMLDKSELSKAPDLENRVWNCDETGLCTAASSKAVFTRRGAKEVHETAGDSGREYITVLGMYDMCMYV